MKPQTWVGAAIGAALAAIFEAICWMVGWPGVAVLAHGLFTERTSEVNYEASSIVALLVLACVMYLGFIYATGQAFRLLGGEVHAFAAEFDSKSTVHLGDRLRDALAKVATVDESAEGVVEAAARRHTKVREIVANLPAGATRRLAELLQPRDLLGAHELATALVNGSEFEAEEVNRQLNWVDGVGRVALIAGLFTTVLGLITAGGHIENQAFVGDALAASLAKMAIAVAARAECELAVILSDARLGEIRGRLARVAVRAFEAPAPQATGAGAVR